jgi:hypothetical protein
MKKLKFIVAFISNCDIKLLKVNLYIEKYQLKSFPAHKKIFRRSYSFLHREFNLEKPISRLQLTATRKDVKHLFLLEKQMTNLLSQLLITATIKLIFVTYKINL